MWCLDSRHQLITATTMTWQTTSPLPPATSCSPTSERFLAITGRAVCSDCWPAARVSTARRSTTPVRRTCRGGTSTVRRRLASRASTVDARTASVRAGDTASHAASTAASAAARRPPTSSTTAATRPPKNVDNCVAPADTDSATRALDDDRTRAQPSPRFVTANYSHSRLVVYEFFSTHNVYVCHRRQSVYNIVGSTEMAKPKGPKSESQRAESGVLGRGCSLPNSYSAWRSAVSSRMRSA